ncbi:MAG: twin-arginine translocase TatA/TatE family subunit [Myxococcota bacterium]
MFGIGAQELVLILVVALLVFGPKRLPDLARTLGRGLSEFRRASNDLRQNLQEAERLAKSDDSPEDAAKPPAQSGEPSAAPAATPDPGDENPSAEETSSDASRDPSEPRGG